MAQVTCMICGKSCSDGISYSCPECGDCVCDDCGNLYEGYCENCFEAVAGRLEQIRVCTRHPAGGLGDVGDGFSDKILINLSLWLSGCPFE